jgi:phage shock protein PspC (stress-responsive transcriptional regulator)
VIEEALFVRLTKEQLLGGVCAGLGRRWMIDRNLVRLAFALLAVASGIGIAIYLLLWLTLPNDKAEPGPLFRMIRGNASEIGGALSSSAQGLTEAWGRTERSSWPRPLTRRWLGIGLVVVGAWMALSSMGLFDWLSAGAVLGLIAIAVGVALIKSLAAPAPKTGGR